MATPFNPAPAPGQGSAYVLQNDNTGLNILRQGQADQQRLKLQANEALNRLTLQGAAAKARADELAAAAQAKAEADLTKRAISDTKLGLDTGEEYQDQIASELAPQAQQALMALYQDKTLEPMQRGIKANEIIRDFEKERLRGTTLSAERVKRMEEFAKPEYDQVYAVQELRKRQRDPSGKMLRPSAFHPESWDEIKNDPYAYNADNNIKKWLADEQVTTLANARAGNLGGTHTSGTATSSLIQTERKADGSVGPVYDKDPATGKWVPRLNYSTEKHEAAMANPLYKMAVKRYQAEYEKARANDPKLPELPEYEAAQQMLRPYGSIKQTLSTGRNAQAPAKAAAKPKPTDIVVRDGVSVQRSDYMPDPSTLSRLQQSLGGKPKLVPNYYPTIGTNFGSQAKPYVDVEVDNRKLEIVGQNGEATKLVPNTTNGKVKLALTDRSYTLYVNNKRLGFGKDFENDEQGLAAMLNKIAELTPDQARKAELRPEYRGTITDKARTAGDGTGAGPDKNSAITRGGRQYGNQVAETVHSVIVPASQYTDMQLERAAAGQKWSARKLTAEQQVVAEALRRKGGTVISPYGNLAPTNAAPARSTSAAAAGRGPLAPLMGKTPQTQAANPSRFTKKKP